MGLLVNAHTINILRSSTLSTMRKWAYAIFGAFLLMMLCAIPVAAGEGTIDSGYEVTPWFEGISLATRSSESSSVDQNDVERFDYYVPSGSKELDVKVSWSLYPKYNSLTLKIYTPSGLFAGEFTDTYESSIRNGIIPVKITSSTPLESGYWKFEVIGTDVSGSQPFLISIQGN